MIFLLLSIVIFVAFITIIIKKAGGILPSISDGWYLFTSHMGSKLYYFTYLLFGILLFLSDVSFLMLLSVALIIGVSVAPDFKKSKFESTMHTIFATSGIFVGIASLGVDYGLWFLSSFYMFLLIIFINRFRGKLITCTWWVEIMAFSFIVLTKLVMYIRLGKELWININ